MKIFKAAMGSLLSLLLATAWSADNPAPSPHVAVLNGNQVVQILDQTVEWYRTLGAQQQSSSQPSDLLIYYANQQTANQVVALAFDIARANAELLSSDASAQASTDSSSSSQAYVEQQTRLKAQRQSIQAEMATHRQASGSAGSADSQAKLSELQGELDMINARLNLLNNMQQFVSASNTSTASVNALKAHIDAIAASIPASNAATAATPAAATPANKPVTPPTPAAAASPATASGQPGIWDLATTCLLYTSPSPRD